MTTSTEILRDRRVLMSVGVGALLGVGALTATTLASKDGTPFNGTPVVAQVGAGSMPDEGGAGAPSAPPAPVTANQAKPPAGGKPAPKMPTSFDNAPKGHPDYDPSGGGQTPGQTTTGLGATGGAAAATGVPKPVVKGREAAGHRQDPFVSRRFAPVEKTPAYNLIAALRMAKYPEPPLPPPNPNPDLQYGPLPYVPRRVAGILFNGSSSAILETAGGFSLISPGSRVSSGIAGLDLTVSAITPSQVTLRADDGRSVNVALSASATPPSSFGGAPGGFQGQGGPGGNFPGRGGFGGGLGGRIGGGGGGAGAGSLD